MTTRAAIYCRISQDREGAGLGVDRQRQDCEQLAARLGWEVVAVHVDNDLSAYSGRPRPGYRHLLEDLESGRADAVLAWHTDRLHRSPRELEEYVELCDRRKVVTQTVKAGEIDLATPSGRAVARTLGAWARFESEHKSDRIRRAHEQAAQAGRWRGGARPFGWRLTDDGAEIDETEAGIVRDAARAVLAGSSIGSVVSDLNGRGVTTSTGRRWNYTSLRQVLTRPRNAGLSELRGEVVGPLDGWPPILEEATWRAVCGLLADPGRRRSRDNRARWLLAGLARCGGTDAQGEPCGAPLRSATADSGPAGARVRRTVYRCSARGGGSHVAPTAEPLDELAAELVIARLAQQDLAPALTPRAVGDAAESLSTEATQLRAKLEETAAAFAEDQITAAQLGTITARVRERLAKVEAELARRHRRTALSAFRGRDPREAWAAATVEQRRALLREMVEITVRPGAGGRHVDLDSVQVRWIEPEE